MEPLRTRHTTGLAKSPLRRLRLTTSIAVASLALALSAPALANYSCTGRLTSVSLAPGTGVVLISSDSGLAAVYLCQIEATSSSDNGPVTPQQCRSFLAILLSAQATGQQVAFAFDDSLSCSTHPAWAWLTGWYFGPQVLSN